MFSAFSACGPVRDIQQEKTQNGTTGTSLLIKTGEWQGRDGGNNEEFVRVTLWKEKAQMAAGIMRGDVVSVSGKPKSVQSDRGYWNVRLQTASLVCVAKAQQQGGYQQQQDAYADQQGYQQQPYAEDDIPFSQGNVQ